jgi:lauroyl/myristoyl acyltransferase
VTLAGEGWKQTLAYYAYRCVSWLGHSLPETTGRRLFTWMGRLGERALPNVRATVAANQAQVLGREVTDPLVATATRQAFERYARFWYDAFHAVDMSDEEVQRRFVVDGEEHMLEAQTKGKGVIFALPHMGNWDVAGRWLAARGQSLVSVAEKLEPERLFQLFLEHRRALGMDIIGLSEEGVGRQLSARLKDNRAVALVADRDLTGRGVEVEMFGRTRRVPAGPALLSITTGAPLIIAGVYETKGGWRCTMSRPLQIEPTGERRADVRALTLAMAAGFESVISASPPDWHMFQPGWEP